MATFNKFNAFVEHLAEKSHNLGSDTLKIALTNTLPTAANDDITDITQISYTNLQSDPTSREFTATQSSQTSGTYTLDAADIVLTASGGTVGPFRYVVLFNESMTSPIADGLIGWYDYGSSITLQDTETFTITWDALGILTLT